MRRTMLTTLTLCFLPSATWAADWVIDPVHSRILVSVDHAGFSTSMALVSVLSGRLHWDPAQPERSDVEATIDLRRLDFGDPRWNASVQGPAMLKTARYPLARFASDKVVMQPDGQLRIEGHLQLRGRAAPVILLAQPTLSRRHPLPPFRQTAGFTAQGQLQRSAYGATAWAAMVGDNVHLRLEIEATLSDRPAEKPMLTDTTDQSTRVDMNSMTEEHSNGQGSSLPHGLTNTGTDKP